MKLATFQTAKGASYGVVTDKGITDLGARLGSKFPDLLAFIARKGDAKNLSQVDFKISEITWLPVIPNPGKIVCVGLNYQDHVVETGRDNTEQPAIFLRVCPSRRSATCSRSCGRASRRTWTSRPRSPSSSARPGAESRRRTPGTISRLRCYNDGSVRDWQRHTIQWTAGKNFARTGGFGPWMVTADEIPPGTKMTLSCRLNGERMQHATTEQMIFKIPKIIEYVSTWTTLQPGDVLVTGTPGGVGARRTPPVWMKPGDKVEIEIDKVGILENSIADG